MPRTLPMLAVIALSASVFSYGQGSNTRYTIVKLKAPSPPTTTPSEPTTPPTTTPTEPTSPPTTTPTDPTTPPSTTPSACSGMDLGAGASLNGFVPFAANNAWRQNIANAPVDGNSGNLVSFIGGANLYANFGAGTYDGNIIGIPYTVVSGSPLTTINYTLYGDESDPGPMPIATSTLIEGSPNPGDGDRHVLVLDRDNCWLYEIGGAYPQGDGTWQAAAGAVWDMQNANARPLRWTSTDAAGLPVFPGLVRYDEVAAGHIDHAIRMTLRRSRAAFVAPATHWAGNSTDANAAPMGMRMRLKAGYDISSFPPQAKVILTALKNYGMIMADNGSNLFLIGAPDDRWNNDDLTTLKQVPSSAFEVVQMPTITTAANLAQGAAPNITSLTASNLTVSAGTAVTLTWAADNASYYVVSPEVGAVRGNTATVHPTATTTYTLYSTNQFGQSNKTITITVQ
ncbi:MAG TPA: hypothetical protein VK596_10990 [Edaphobacter sp.]|nr:hypothetical protein [Edaphobacter sp.]